MIDPQKLSESHVSRYAATPALVIAPGRVNLIGEHTDYAEGFVMPAAINFATVAAISPRSDGQVAIYSENFGEEGIFSAEALPPRGTRHWTSYPLGVLSVLMGEGYRFPGFSLSLWGDVPLGSGLSSSASVEVATGLALLSLIDGQIPGPRLARLCQRAENEYVGANCGIMDQFISANGAANHALLLDCRDLSYRPAPIPDHVALVIANTMIKHSITDGGYPQRRAEVEEVCRIIATHRPEVKFLRDATVEDLAQWGHEMPEKAVRRARHVITECARTVQACEALSRGDLALLGSLMAEAHRSYSEDFEGSCREADIMVAQAQGLPGLIGARLTGGGFGGCTINLVEIDQAERFAQALKARYRSATGIEPEIHICQASAGAHRLR